MPDEGDTPPEDVELPEEIEDEGGSLGSVSADAVGQYVAVGTGDGELRALAKVLATADESVTTVISSAVLAMCPADRGATPEVCRESFGRFGGGGLLVGMAEGITAIMVPVGSCRCRSNIGCVFMRCCL